MFSKAYRLEIVRDESVTLTAGHVDEFYVNLLLDRSI